MKEKTFGVKAGLEIWMQFYDSEQGRECVT